MKVKEAHVEGRRYVVCLNPEEARKDAHDREAIVASRRKRLKRGDKSLVGNRGFRKYLADSKQKFEIDGKKIEKGARCRVIPNRPADRAAVSHVHSPTPTLAHGATPRCCARKLF